MHLFNLCLCLLAFSLPLQAQSWGHFMRQAIIELQTQGDSHYSTQEDAHIALVQSFVWDAKRQLPLYQKQKPYPVFCSGAVYVALLKALIDWEKHQAQRSISPQAWQALLPLRYQDGEKAWGWANANGPGFAVLIKALGAGYSFTAWDKAQAYDIIKIWWTDELGAKERGHLALLLSHNEQNVQIWSANQANATDKQGGFSIRSYPKADIKRVLFTRITQPQAFAQATRIGWNEYLHQLLHKDTTWQQCIKVSN